MPDVPLTDPQIRILRLIEAGDSALRGLAGSPGLDDDLERLGSYGYITDEGLAFALTPLGARVLYGVDREWSDTGRGGLDTGPGGLEQPG